MGNIWTILYYANKKREGGTIAPPRGTVIVAKGNLGGGAPKHAGESTAWGD